MSADALVVKRESWLRRWHWFILPSALIVIAIGVAFYGHARIKRESRNEVIRLILSGQMSISPGGITTLPASLASASVGGEIYASSPSSGQMLIAFKDWIGKGRNMSGLLFCSRPLTSGDIEKDYYGEDVIQVGPIQLVLEKQIDPNWYEVSYGLD